MKFPVLTFILMAITVLTNIKAIDLHYVTPEITIESDSPMELPDFNRILMETVEERDVFNSLKVIPEEWDKPVLSLIDAGSLAMNRSRNYLLYGIIQVNDLWCEAKISLYELETDSVRTIFYSKAATGRFSELASELGRKMVDYFYDHFGISDRSVINKSPGYLELSVDGGYWGILSAQWNDVSMGYFHCGLNLAVGLTEPRLYFDGHELYPRFGLGFNYGYSRNKTGLEPFSSHSFQIYLPLELILDLRKYHQFGFILSPGYEIDYLVQERLYGDVFTDASSAFVLKTGLSYMFNPPGKPVRFGMVHMFDFAFYDDLLVSYKPSIRVAFKIHNFGETSDEE